MKERYFSAKEEEIWILVGQREPGKVSPGDIAALDGIKKGRYEEEVEQTMVRRECATRYGNRPIICGGGLPNIVSMQTQYNSPSFDYPYTLWGAFMARKRGQTLVLHWNYVEAVIRSILETDEEKGQGTFEKVHGYGLTNWQEIPHRVWLDIATLDKSKAAGVKPLQWKLLREHPDGTSEVLIEVAKVPFTRGDDAFLTYIGPNIYNSAQRQVMTVGGRAGSTKAGNAIFERDEGFLKEIEGSNEFLGELYRLIKEHDGPHSGVVYAGQTVLEKGQPVKIGELLAIEFLL